MRQIGGRSLRTGWSQWKNDYARWRVKFVGQRHYCIRIYQHINKKREGPSKERDVRHQSVRNINEAMNRLLGLIFVFPVGKIMNMFHFYWPFISKFVPGWNFSRPSGTFQLYRNGLHRNVFVEAPQFSPVTNICILIVSLGGSEALFIWNSAVWLQRGALGPPLQNESKYQKSHKYINI